MIPSCRDGQRTAPAGRKCSRSSPARTLYENAGKRRILVRVIDIFGNETRQAFDVDVNYALGMPDYDAQLTGQQRS